MVEDVSNHPATPSMLPPVDALHLLLDCFVCNNGLTLYDSLDVVLVASSADTVSYSPFGVYVFYFSAHYGSFNFLFF